MLTTIIIVCLLVAVFLILLQTPVVVAIDLRHEGVRTEGQIRVRAILGLVRLTRKLDEMHPKWTSEGPAIKSVHQHATTKKQEESTLTTSEVLNYVTHWNHYASIFRRGLQPVRWMLRRVQMTKVTMDVHLGTGDAVATGCLVGALWGGVGLVVGELSNLTRLVATPRLTIQPDFSAIRLDADVHCIGRVRLGYAITGVIRMLLTWMSIKKNLGSQSRPRKEEKTWSTPSRG